MPPARTFLLRASGVLVFLSLWELGPRLGWVDPYFVPPFATILSEIGLLIRNNTLPVHLLVSGWRALSGLVIALLVALPTGVLLGRWFTAVAAAIDPILRVLSQVNPFTLLPVFILFFGIGETAKVMVVAWVTLWPILFYTITAVRTIDPVLVKSAAAMGCGREEILLKVVVPAALPTIFVGIRIGAGLTFYILVAAEMLGANSGVGWLVHNSAMNYVIPRIYAGATFIVVLGYLLNRALRHLERALFAGHAPPLLTADSAIPALPPWRPGMRTILAGAAVVLLVLAAGGWVVQRLNREAALAGYGSADHSKHIGTPVDSGDRGI